MFSQIRQSAFAMEFLIWPLFYLDKSIRVLERGGELGRRNCSKLLFLVFILTRTCEYPMGNMNMW